MGDDFHRAVAQGVYLEPADTMLYMADARRLHRQRSSSIKSRSRKLNERMSGVYDTAMHGDHFETHIAQLMSHRNQEIDEVVMLQRARRYGDEVRGRSELKKMVKRVDEDKGAWVNDPHAVYQRPESSSTSSSEEDKPLAPWKQLIGSRRDHKLLKDRMGDAPTRQKRKSWAGSLLRDGRPLLAPQGPEAPEKPNRQRLARHRTMSARNKGGHSKAKGAASGDARRGQAGASGADGAPATGTAWQSEGTGDTGQGEGSGDCHHHSGHEGSEAGSSGAAERDGEGSGEDEGSGGESASSQESDEGSACSAQEGSAGAQSEGTASSRSEAPRGGRTGAVERAGQAGWTGRGPLEAGEAGTPSRGTQGRPSPSAGGCRVSELPQSKSSPSLGARGEHASGAGAWRALQPSLPPLGQQKQDSPSIGAQASPPARLSLSDDSSGPLPASSSPAAMSPDAPLSSGSGGSKGAGAWPIPTPTPPPMLPSYDSCPARPTAFALAAPPSDLPAVQQQRSVPSGLVGTALLGRRPSPPGAEVASPPHPQDPSPSPGGTPSPAGALGGGRALPAASDRPSPAFRVGNGVGQGSGGESARSSPSEAGITARSSPAEGSAGGGGGGGRRVTLPAVVVETPRSSGGDAPSQGQSPHSGPLLKRALRHSVCLPEPLLQATGQASPSGDEGVRRVTFPSDVDSPRGSGESAAGGPGPSSVSGGSSRWPLGRNESFAEGDASRGAPDRGSAAVGDEGSRRVAFADGEQVLGLPSPPIYHGSGLAPAWLPAGDAPGGAGGGVLRRQLSSRRSSCPGADPPEPGSSPQGVVSERLSPQSLLTPFDRLLGSLAPPSARSVQAPAGPRTGRPAATARRRAEKAAAGSTGAIGAAAAATAAAVSNANAVLAAAWQARGAVPQRRTSQPGQGIGSGTGTGAGAGAGGGGGAGGGALPSVQRAGAANAVASASVTRLLGMVTAARRSEPGAGLLANFLGGGKARATDRPPGQAAWVAPGEPPPQLAPPQPPAQMLPSLQPARGQRVSMEGSGLQRPAKEFAGQRFSVDLGLGRPSMEISGQRVNADLMARPSLDISRQRLSTEVGFARQSADSSARNGPDADARGGAGAGVGGEGARTGNDLGRRKALDLSSRRVTLDVGG